MNHNEIRLNNQKPFPLKESSKKKKKKCASVPSPVCIVKISSIRDHVEGILQSLHHLSPQPSVRVNALHLTCAWDIHTLIVSSPFTSGLKENSTMLIEWNRQPASAQHSCLVWESKDRPLGSSMPSFTSTVLSVPSMLDISILGLSLFQSDQYRRLGETVRISKKRF